jgi:hypothetical protein
LTDDVQHVANRGLLLHRIVKFALQRLALDDAFVEFVLKFSDDRPKLGTS